MSFQTRIRKASHSAKLLTAALAAGCCLIAVAEKPPAPAFRLPLQGLGFPGYAPVLMRVGSYSMTTMHLLDSTHLLFTYSLRSLVPRLPGDDENDSDRLVAAEVVELPTGRILARTQWRLHDHGRYLWRAGHGLFVLRSANELSTFAPLRGLERGTAFQRVALPHQPGMPQIVSSSPDGAILTLQVQPEGEEVTEADGEIRKSKHTVIQFYRISATEGSDAPIEVTQAGAVGAPGFLRLALDGDGYLWAEDQDRNRWSVSFNEYEGKPQTLTTVSSSCPPRLSLLSRGEFLVESCRGADDTPTVSAYGFDGHENWEEPFGQTLQPPTIVTAPESGRFAMSRLLASSGGTGINNLAPEDPMTQEIRVYQTESGDMLLHLQCATPVRTAENFDLSPDGTTLAVLGHDAIEVYKLPPLSARDRKDLADVKTMLPPVSQSAVVLRRILQPVQPDRVVLQRDDSAAASSARTADATAGGAAAGTPDTSSVASTTAAGAPASEHAADSAKAAEAATPVAQQASAGAVAADPGQSTAVEAAPAPRKPPTLLGPGESPEFKGPTSGNPR